MTEKEKKPKLFLIRNSFGEITKRMSEPNVVFDTQTGEVFKIGSFDEVYPFYDTLITAHLVNNDHEKIQHMHLMSLPKDQVIIDKVCTETGFIKEIYKQKIKK